MEKRPAANAAPSFTDEDDKVTGKQASRTVDETAKAGSSIGDPVAATDTNNDPLLYTLVDYDDPLQGDLDGSGALNEIDESTADTNDVDGDGNEDETLGDIYGDLDGDGDHY